MMKSIHRWLTVLLLLFATPVSASAADASVDFSHDVVPILKKHCVQCHGGQESKGGFSLNTRELLLDAEAIEPGRADDSRIIQLVASADPDEQMPPKDQPRVSSAEIVRLRAWITQGAAWEAGFTFAPDRYEPPLAPRRPQLPAATDGRDHPLDRLIDAYLHEREIPRPAPISDAVFLRRLYLDVIGLLPEPDVRASFLADNSADKRTKLVHTLLGPTPSVAQQADAEAGHTGSLDYDVAYAEHWLTFWNDLLRNDYSGTGFITGGRKQITAWLYQSLLSNKPYDQIVHELIAPNDASDGFIRGIRWRGNVNASQTQEIQFAQNVGQALLGINLKCASCHDSFIDRWTLAETYALAQVYATAPLELHRCDKPTGQMAQAGWLFPELGQINANAPQAERLQQLAELLTHPGNGRLTRTIANRFWHRLMGRGIVHPVDAMHTEPWYLDLLDFLAVDLADHGYDLKHTISLICTSQAYQAAVPRLDPASQSGPYVFRGPLARRMTAEQFMDAVWQVTQAAPAQHDAQVVRFMTDVAKQERAEVSALTGRWIWKYPEAAGGVPTAGETMVVRRTFNVADKPLRAVAAITADNEYTMYVNGRQAAADGNWETVEAVSLTAYLKVGKNELLIVARNGGGGPNPAGLFCEVRIVAKNDSETVFGTDSTWQWTASKPDRRGRFKQPPADWATAAIIAKPEVWSGRVHAQLIAILNAASDSAPQMVRASLMKNNAFLRALGRPMRDQIVSMRPAELTTLEAIDLANGQTLADAIASGAQTRLAEFGGDSAALSRWLFTFALSREPSAEEQQLADLLLGSQPSAADVADLMWSVCMLPEFQLIR